MISKIVAKLVLIFFQPPPSISDAIPSNSQNMHSPIEEQVCLNYFFFYSFKSFHFCLKKLPDDLKINGDFEVIVCDLQNPGHFWIQLKSMVPKLRRLMEKMQNYYESKGIQQRLEIILFNHNYFLVPGHLGKFNLVYFQSRTPPISYTGNFVHCNLVPNTLCILQSRAQYITYTVIPYTMPNNLRIPIFL